MLPQNIAESLLNKKYIKKNGLKILERKRIKIITSEQK